MAPALGDRLQQGTVAPGTAWEGFFSHLLGLLLLGAAQVLAGAVGHRKQRDEGFQPSAVPGRGEGKTCQLSDTPVSWGWERSTFRLAQAAPPVWTGSSSTGSALCSMESRTGSAVARGDSNEVNFGTPPHPPDTLPLCKPMKHHHTTHPSKNLINQLIKLQLNRK